MKSVVIASLFVCAAAFANPPAGTPAAGKAADHASMGHKAKGAHTKEMTKTQTKEMTKTQTQEMTQTQTETATEAKTAECKNKGTDGKCMDEGAMKK